MQSCECCSQLSWPLACLDPISEVINGYCDEANLPFSSGEESNYVYLHYENGQSPGIRVSSSSGCLSLLANLWHQLHLCTNRVESTYIISQ